jgi:MFS family permease
VLLLALFLIAVVLSVFAFVLNLASLKPRLHRLRLLPGQKTTLLLALVWAVVYLIFLFFWLPQNTFYRLFYLPALIILLGLALSAFPRTRRRAFATALFTAAVALANFLFLIYPSSHVEKYPPLAFALQMNRDWPAGTVIYYGAQNSDEALVRYFNRNASWKLLAAEYPSDTNAWLETSAIDRLASTPEGTRWLQTHTRSGSLRELNNGDHRIRFVQLSP